MFLEPGKKASACIPAPLAMEARVALALRTVGGLIRPEIARACLTRETTMGWWITRAKAKAIAIAELDGPQVVLAAIDRIRI